MSTTLIRTDGTDNYIVLSQYDASSNLEVAIAQALVQSAFDKTTIEPSNPIYTSPANDSSWNCVFINNEYPNYINTSAISNYPSGTLPEYSVISSELTTDISLNSYTTNISNNLCANNTYTFKELPTTSSYYDSNYVFTQNLIADCSDNQTGSYVKATFNVDASNAKIQYAMQSRWNTTLGPYNGLQTVGPDPTAITQDVSFNTDSAFAQYGSGATDASYESYWFSVDASNGSLVPYIIDASYQPINNDLFVTNRDMSGVTFNVNNDVGIFRIQQVSDTPSTTVSKNDSSFNVINNNDLTNIPFFNGNGDDPLVFDSSKNSLPVPGNMSASQFTTLLNADVLATVADQWTFKIDVSANDNSGYNIDIQHPLISDLNNSNLLDNPFYMQNYVSNDHSITFSNASIAIDVSTNGTSTDATSIIIDLSNGETLTQVYAGVDGQIIINTNTYFTRYTDLSNVDLSGNFLPFVAYSGDITGANPNSLSNEEMINPYFKGMWQKVAQQSSVTSPDYWLKTDNSAIMTLFTEQRGIIDNLYNASDFNFSFNNNFGTNPNIQLWKITGSNNIIVNPESFYTNASYTIPEIGIATAGLLTGLTEDISYNSYRVLLTAKEKEEIGLYSAVTDASGWELNYTTADTFLHSSADQAFSKSALPIYDQSVISGINGGTDLNFSYTYKTILDASSAGGLSDYVDISYNYNGFSNVVTINQTDITRDYYGDRDVSFVVVPDASYSFTSPPFNKDSYQLVYVTANSKYNASFFANYGPFTNIQLTVRDILQTDIYYAVRNKSNGKLTPHTVLAYVTAPDIPDLNNIDETIIASQGNTLSINGTFTANDLKAFYSIVQGENTDYTWIDIGQSINTDVYYGLINNQSLLTTATLTTTIQYNPFSNSVNSSINVDLNLLNYYIPFVYDQSNNSFYVENFTSSPSTLAANTNIGSPSFLGNDNYLTLTNGYDNVNETSWSNSGYTVILSHTLNTTTFTVNNLSNVTQFTITLLNNTIFLGTFFVSYIPQDYYRVERLLGPNAATSTYSESFISTNYVTTRVDLSPTLQGVYINSNTIGGINPTNSPQLGSYQSFRVIGDYMNINEVGTTTPPTSTSELGINYNNNSLTFQYVQSSTFASGFGTRGLAFDNSGNLYWAQQSTNTIRKITSTGGDNGTLFASGLNNPRDIAFDNFGNLYCANLGNNTISKITSTGVVSRFVDASSGLIGPYSLAFDNFGNLYCSNITGNTISKITSAGVVSTFASGLSAPSGLAFDNSGNLYCANNLNNTISKITPGGVVSHFASGLLFPIALVFDNFGNLYCANLTNANIGNNTISKITSDGSVSTFIRGLNTPTNLAFDDLGNLYFGNASITNIIKITPSSYSAAFTFPKYRGYKSYGISNLNEYYVINRDATSVTFDVAGSINLDPITDTLTSNMSYNGSFNVDNLRQVGSDDLVANLGVTGYFNYSIPPSGSTLTYPVNVTGDNVLVTIANPNYSYDASNIIVPQGATPVINPRSYSNLPPPYATNWIATDASRNWRSVSISSTGQYQTALVNGEFIYLSTNYGNTWTATATDASRNWTSVSISSSGQYQTAVVQNGKIYVSSNYGNTWTDRPEAGSRAWLSVAISSTGQYQTAGDYATGFIYTSSDYGDTWTARPAAGTGNWRGISLSSSGQYQTAVSQGQFIYVSTDYGNTWIPKMTDQESRNWISVSISSTGQYQTAVVFGGRIYNSTNYGNTWTVNNSSPIFPDRFWNSVSISSTGQYQTAVVQQGLIYASSNYGNIWTSKPAAGSRYWNSVSVSSTGENQTAVTQGEQIYISNNPTPTLKNYGQNDMYTFSGNWYDTNGRLMAIRPSRVKTNNTAYPYNKISYQIQLLTSVINLFKAKNVTGTSSFNWLGNPSIKGEQNPEAAPSQNDWALQNTYNMNFLITNGITIGKKRIYQQPNTTSRLRIIYIVSAPPYYKFEQTSTASCPVIPYNAATQYTSNKTQIFMPYISTSNGILRNTFNPFAPSTTYTDISGNNTFVQNNANFLNNVSFNLLSPPSITAAEMAPVSTRYGIIVPGTNLTVSLYTGLYNNTNTGNHSNPIWRGPVTSIPSTPNINRNALIFRGRDASGGISFSALQYPADIGYPSGVDGYEEIFRSDVSSNWYNIDFNMGNSGWFNNNSPITYFNTESTGIRNTLYTVVDVNDHFNQINKRRVYKYTTPGTLDIDISSGSISGFETLNMIFNSRSYHDFDISKNNVFPDASGSIWKYNNLLDNTVIPNSSISWTLDSSYSDTAYISWAFGNSYTATKMLIQLFGAQPDQQKWAYIKLEPFMRYLNQFNMQVGSVAWDGTVTAPLVNTRVVNLAPSLTNPSLLNNTYATQQYSESTL